MRMRILRKTSWQAWLGGLVLSAGMVGAQPGYTADTTMVWLCPHDEALHPLFLTPGVDKKTNLTWGAPRSEDIGPGCEKMMLPVPPTYVQWVGLVSTQQSKTLLSTGAVLNITNPSTNPLEDVTDEHAISVSSIETITAPPDRVIQNPKAWLNTLLNAKSSGGEASAWRAIALNQAHTFGREERAALTKTKTGTLTLQCKPGKAPAGAIFQQPTPIVTAQQPFEVEFKTQGGSGRVDVGFRHTGQRPDADSIAVGTLSLPQSGQGPWTVKPDEPLGAIDSWVFICPETGASIPLHSARWRLASTAAATTDPQSSPVTYRTPVRSMWSWTPGVWQTQADTLIATLADHSIRKVYIDIPLTPDQTAVQDPEQLKTFIGQARKAGIAVWVVEGAPEAVLDSQQARWIRRAIAFQRYNNQAGRDAQLAGIQYDVEPYLLQGYHLDPTQWNRAYLTLLTRIKAAVALPLDAAMPFWFAQAGVPQGRLLDQLSPVLDTVTVMDYRTSWGEIEQFAEPFLAWGLQHNKGIQIALENTALPNETYWVFQPAGSPHGRLWLVPWHNRTLAVLLSKNEKNPWGPSLAFSHKKELQGSHLSFHKNQADLWQQLPQWEATFRRWPSFQGIALHHWDAIDWSAAK